jgi:hypothetical protein
MDMSEIQKKLAEFEATLKPVAKKPTKAPEPEPIPATIQPPVPAGSQPEPAPSDLPPCFSPDFIKLVKSLVPSYVGANGITAFLDDVFQQVPTCSEEEMAKELAK